MLEEIACCCLLRSRCSSSLVIFSFNKSSLIAICSARILSSLFFSISSIFPFSSRAFSLADRCSKSFSSARIVFVIEENCFCAAFNIPACALSAGLKFGISRNTRALCNAISARRNARRVSISPTSDCEIIVSKFMRASPSLTTSPSRTNISLIIPPSRF